MKENMKKWLTLMILILAGGTIFKLSSLKDAFYIPMQEYFHLTHTQIGMALSVYAIVQTIGYVFSIYLSDRFSRKIMLPLGLIGVGVIGLYLSTFPGYIGILAAWGGMAVFAEVIFWPVLIKTVRLLGDSDEQGRMFGFLEAGRGVIDTIIAFSGLALFVKLGSNAVGFRAAILFFSAATIIVGIVVYFFIEPESQDEVSDEGEDKKAVALAGAKRAVKIPELWIASLIIFCVYTVYAGLTYFIPFLKDVYKMPVALVGAYGIINQYGLKMIGGPVGGIMSDKVFKSPTKYLKYTFLIAAAMIGGFTLLPHNSMNIYLGMTCTLLFGSIIFSQRAIFFAPLDEIDIPKEISGAAVSIACLVGYAPSMFAFTLYGTIIDKFPGLTGYRYVFMVMAGFAIAGFVVCTYLLKKIEAKKRG